MLFVLYLKMVGNQLRQFLLHLLFVLDHQTVMFLILLVLLVVAELLDLMQSYLQQMVQTLQYQVVFVLGLVTMLNTPSVLLLLSGTDALSVLLLQLLFSHH